MGSSIPLTPPFFMLKKQFSAIEQSGSSDSWIALEQTSNRPFLIYLVFISNWRTFHMKTSMICKKMNMSDTCRWNTFPYKWVCTKTGFDRYEKGNLEMASTRMSIGSSTFAQLFFNIFYFSCLFFQLHTCIDRHTRWQKTLFTSAV